MEGFWLFDLPSGIFNRNLKEPITMNDFLYGVFPYLAFSLAVAGGLYRYFADRFSFSSLSSQFLESGALFYGSIPWHYGIGLILLAHLVGGLLPAASAFLLHGPARLFAGELVGMSLGFLALLGMVVLIIRRLSNSRILAVTTTMDWVLIAALTFQAATGVITALFYRWGSLWYLDTAVPWFWSIAGLNPRFDTVISLPWLVQFHILNAFVIFALFPFTRLVHLIAVPLSYLWRPYQVVIWNQRAGAPAAAEGPAPGRTSEAEASPGLPLPAAEINRRSFLAKATGLLTFFVAAAAGIPLIGGMIGEIYREKKRDWVKVTDVASLPVNQPVNPSFPMQVTQAYLRETELRKVWVVRQPDNRVTVFSPVCPHLGCHYHWNPQNKHFECPCHGSIYALDGKVLGGPAPRSLDTLPAKVEGGTLMVKWEEFRVGIPQQVPT
jgi:nitrate reductase gamma subunit